MTAVIFRPKILSRTRVHAVKNRKCSGYVDCQQTGSNDRNLLSKLKLLILRQWQQLWMKSIAIKQRYRKNLVFAGLCLIVLLQTRWVNWFTVDVSLHASFLLRLYRCIRVCKRTIGYLLLCFSLLFSVVQLWNYTATIQYSLQARWILLNNSLDYYSTIFTSPSPNNCET